MPSDEEAVRHYREDYWQWYRDEQVGAGRENVYEHAWSWLERLMPTPGALVDVGCGGGSLLALCRTRGWKGIGFDPSVQAVAYAQGQGLEAYAQAFPPCTLPDGAVDAVTFINVLDHLQDPFEALREAWRVLRFGGLLYIRVPNGPFHAGLLPLLSAIRLNRFTVFHLYGFGRSAFQYHLSRLGFEILAVRTAPPSQGDAYEGSGSCLTVVEKSLRLVGHLACRLWGSLGLDRIAWGPSIEVVARKDGFSTTRSEDRGEK